MWGCWIFYAPRCNTQITKSAEFRFHAVLNENAPEVRFERVTPNEPCWRSDRSNADDNELKDKMATQVGSALVEVHAPAREGH